MHIKILQHVAILVNQWKHVDILSNCCPLSYLCQIVERHSLVTQGLHLRMCDTQSVVQRFLKRFLVSIERHCNFILNIKIISVVKDSSSLNLYSLKKRDKTDILKLTNNIFNPVNSKYLKVDRKHVTFHYADIIDFK